MTTADQMQAITDKIIREALDIVRAEAEQRDDAAEAAEWTRLRVRLTQDSPEMPGPGMDQWTRLLR